MSNTIEPPVLLSRLMAFVFSAALVVVVVLIVTLVKLFPLSKTQVFFLTTEPRENMEIRLTSFTPDAENLETYKQTFVKEYIKARNEIIPAIGVMQKKWSASEDGTVYKWSAPDVYMNFQNTSMWNNYMAELPGFEFNCPVEFNTLAKRTDDTYAVNFTYFCTNSNGQTDDKDYTIVLKKDYTIIVKLKLEEIIKWTDRLQNPLGIKVTEYEIEVGGTDPLDFKWD